MKVYIDDAMVLHICPKDGVEVMALKYWYKEFQTHGMKMLEVEGDTDLHCEITGKSKYKSLPKS